MNNFTSFHAPKTRLGSLALASATALSALVASANANAARFNGTYRVTGNKTLTGDVYGAVVFDSSNARLDCNNYQIHISSNTRALCSVPGVGLQKCAVTVQGKSNITLERCNIVGGFDQGVFVSRGDTVDIVETTISGVLDAGVYSESSLNVTIAVGAAYVNHIGFFFELTRTGHVKTATAAGNFVGFLQDGGNVGYWWSASADENDVGFWGKRLGPKYGWSATKYGSYAPYGVPVEASRNTYEGLFIEDSDAVELKNLELYENNLAAHPEAAGLAFSDVDWSKIDGVTALDNEVCDVRVDAASQNNVWGSARPNTFWSRCGNVP